MYYSYLKPLTYLINKSFTEGIFPVELKLARGIPICNNNNCLKSNIQCIEIRVQWTVHLGSSHMHVHAVTRVHAVTPKLVICVMYLTSI